MSQNFVDLWSADLSDVEVERAHALAVLSAQELLRLAGFKQAVLADRYIAVRFIVRTVLADYLQVAPASLEFTVAEYGKPVLQGHDLAFNIAHSGDRLLIAISNLSHIGVDIEQIRPRSNLAALVRRCCSPVECQFWAGLAEADQQRYFYEFWVRKEAFVKAVGRGIALGLDQCELALPAMDGFERVPVQVGHAVDWQVTAVGVGDGFVAALVAPARLAVSRQYEVSLR